MIKNKWKLAFWICSGLLLLAIAFGLYCIIDQSITITYMTEGYTRTENDLNTLIQIVTKQDLSKQKIKESLKGNKTYDIMEFDKDTIEFQRIELIFKSDTLRQIVKQ